MRTEVLLVQGLVLVFTAVLWWIARRDLAARAALPVPGVPPAETAELEQLCATLEALVTDLSRRMEAAESRLPPLKALETPPAPAVVPELPPDTRHASVYALLESGLSDPVEIARQTGLGRGEVDLILSLRGRRVL